MSGQDEAGGRRRLVVCIDDYALRPGVDAAVLALAAQRRVSAVSCLVGSPRWPAAARELAQLDRTGLDVGLHLDFTEAPLNRALRSELGSFIARAYLGQLPRAAIAAEIAAQFDAFETALGRSPDHVDGHQHVHQLPGVRELLLQELARRGSHRPWLRSTRRPAGEPGLKPRILAALGDGRLRRLAGRQGLATSRHLLGVYDFAGSAAQYRARLAGWLGRAGENDVLMCHPAQGPLDGAADPIAAARAVEYEVLAGADWPQLLAAGGFTVAPLQPR